MDSAKLAALELILYGNTGVDPRLPLPNEVSTIFAESAPSALTVSVDPADDETGVLVSDNIVLTFKIR